MRQTTNETSTWSPLQQTDGGLSDDSIMTASSAELTESFGDGSGDHFHCLTWLGIEPTTNNHQLPWAKWIMRFRNQYGTVRLVGVYTAALHTC